MAQTKVKLISDGVIDVNHLASGHGITTDNIGEGSNLYYTDARVSTYLSTNNYATEGYVTTAVANLVDSAPTTLDTLNELAAALGDDPNFATTVTNSIATKLPLAGGTLTGGLHINTTSLPQLLIQNADGGTNAERIAIELTSGDIFKVRSLNDNNTTRVDNIITANILTGNLGLGSTASGNSRLTIHGTHVSGNSILSVVPVGDNVATIGVYNSAGNRRGLFYSDTGLVRLESDVDPIQIYAGGVNGINVTTDGNVGIGNSTPNFVTSGRRVLELNGSSEALMSFAVNGTWQYYIHALTSGIYHATGDKDFVIQPGTANVGIGVTSPDYKLDVRSSTIAGSFTAGDGGYTAVRFDGDAGATIGSLTTHNGLIYLGSQNTSGTGANGEIRIQPHSGGVLYLDSSRNVGIGATPYAWNLGRVLELDGSNAAVSFSGNSGILGIVNAYFDGSSYRRKLNGTVASFEYGLSVQDAFSWRTEGYDTAGLAIDMTPKMVFTNAGRLGIGTNSPVSKLEVREDSSVNNENYVHFERRTGTQSSYDATGLRIVSLAKNNTGKSGISYIGLDTRSSVLNGSHGANGFITLTPGSGSVFGDGQFDFFLRNNSGPFTFNNDPSVTSNYWQDSLMTITSSGHILKHQQPAFHARCTSSSIGNGNYIVYQTAYVNRGNHYNPSTGIFTAPIAGLYYFFWGAIGNNSGTVYRYFLRLNNSSVWPNSGSDIHLRQDTSFTYDGSGNGFATNGYRVHMQELQANDQVRIYFYSDSGHPSYAGSDYLTFGGYLIG